MKPVPNFWWDYGEWNDEIGEIIVESDIPDKPIVGRFSFSGYTARVAIVRAEKLIADLDAGRKTA
jgi:hypothetical protein